MIKMDKCSFNRLHVTTITLAESAASGLIITADYAVFNNEGTGEGCSGRSVGPWSAEVMKKVKSLNESIEKELKSRLSGEAKEESDDDSDRGSVRGIPGGLKPKLGSEPGSIEQL